MTTQLGQMVCDYSAITLILTTHVALDRTLNISINDDWQILDTNPNPKSLP
jgi:hypothetical protein